MLELAGILFVGAVAMTFISDAASRTMKLMRAGRSRRGEIHVASPEQSH